MKVSFYATLRQIVGQKSIEFELPEGATLRQLLDQMLEKYPALQHEMLDADGNMFAYVHLFVNGRDAPFLENSLDTVLKPDDVIGVFPAVGGG